MNADGVCAPALLCCCWPIIFYTPFMHSSSSLQIPDLFIHLHIHLSHLSPLYLFPEVIIGEQVERKLIVQNLCAFTTCTLLY